MDVVRCWVLRALVGVPVLPRLRTCLIAEELVRNARVHGCAPCLLRLALDATGRALRVFVEDCDPRSSGTWTTGAGLAFVDGMSRGWGVMRRDGGKTVWAEVALGLRMPGITIPPVPPSSHRPKRQGHFDGWS